MSVTDSSYAAVMARRNEIMKASLGIDYDDFVDSPIAFDYERMMAETGYSHDDIARIQRETKVGDTPLVELRNLTGPCAGCARQGRDDPAQGRGGQRLGELQGAARLDQRLRGGAKGL